MKNIFSSLLLVSALFSSSAYAIPELQLDASNANYVGGTVETTIAVDPAFSLFALVNSLTPSGTYYISAALTKASGAGDYGSFVFNGSTINVTSDMAYGTPNLLQSHGIFPAYYKEFSFNFSTADSSNKFTNYDVQNIVGTHNGPVQSNSGNARFAEFEIDLSGLAADVGIHFDLYQYGYKHNGELQITKAPFSHDAEGNGGGGGNDVPDSGTSAILLGLGLISLAVFRRTAA